ncbi:TonB family protein [Dysgonomonas mossii]|uniref:Energy transducer TonB n=1 Tax=Dysgonomonas mossii TaxID=163665 RepID=A0A4Y9IPH8_9BACT|nr:energy transducer TonB [uncultured Dysgonomonas sp.]MBF0759476.1 TonB family protein [Dysgonomonas mossii]TFU90447.1 energy transducer TonB [Dysgonomonas mossii]
MRSMFFYLFFYIAIICNAQTNGNVLITTEPMPTYPGGESALYSFIEKNLEYPKSVQKQGIEGQVVVQFNIAPNGEVVNVRIKEGLESSCDSAVVRMVKMMPKWIPVNKNRLSDEFTLPVIFKLKSE